MNEVPFDRQRSKRPLARVRANCIVDRADTFAARESHHARRNVFLALENDFMASCGQRSADDTDPGVSAIVPGDVSDASTDCEFRHAFTYRCNGAHGPCRSRVR